MTSNSPEHDNPSGASAVPSRGSSGPTSPTSPTSQPDAPAAAPRRTPGSKDSSGTKDASATKGRKSGRSAAAHGDWNVFRTVVVLVGIILAGFGAYYLLLGTAGLPETDGTPVNPTLESQFRFFSAMTVGVGAAFITIAIKFQWANMLWLVCLMVFMGGIGRVLSWAFSGTPHYLLIVLMVVEIAFPPALLVWHKYIATTSDLRREYAQRG